MNATMQAAMNAAIEMTDRSRLLRVAALRAIERSAARRWPAGTLMQRAGEAAAREAMTMMLERPGPVLVLAGPGNNGGDALVAARILRERDIDVRVALLDEASRFRGEAADACARWCEAAGDDAWLPDPSSLISRATLLIDGLFGIGIARAPSGKAREWIALVNAERCPVLALDVPSGLDADTGRVIDVAIEADRTISFIAAKPGLYTADGPDHCGDIVIDTLACGLQGALDDDGLKDAHLEPGQIGAINRPALFDAALKPRRANSHKGSFGSVAVIGGSDGMVGAALLAARMALLCGAGRVYVHLLARPAPAFDVVHPELMFRQQLGELDADANAVAIGPGLGQGDAALAMLERSIATRHPIVLDADALNAVAAHRSLFDRLAQRSAQGLPPAVLTPHPLEAARLLGVDAAAVQADRIAAATGLARRSESVVVLKGAGTVIADPSGVWVINTTGNPGLATGGTGDVLCGLVAGLLAQHLLPLDAARAATWLHGSAADDLAAQGIGPIGLSASELLPAIRQALNRLCRVELV